MFENETQMVLNNIIITYNVTHLITYDIYLILSIITAIIFAYLASWVFRC